MLLRQQKRLKRHKRIRAKISGVKERPRLSVFRSARHIYAQLVDDKAGKILAASSDREIKKLPKGKTAIALEVGKLIARKAKDLKIEKVAFDRGGYQYHGRVKSLAEGAREGGLKF